MHCCSFWEAFAEMVMMALMKSPAAVWTTQLFSGLRQERRVGMMSLEYSHYVRIKVSAVHSENRSYQSGCAYLDNTLATFITVQGNNLEQEVHDHGALDMPQQVGDGI